MNGKASLHASVLLVGFLALAATGEAQEYTYESGYIRYLDGSVSLQRAQNPEPEPGSVNLPVLPGDRMWTTANSFAEIRFVDGALVRLGEETKVDFMAFGAEPNLRLWNGSIVVKVDSESSRVRIDTPSGSVYPQTAGTYRVDVVDGVTTSVSVLQGVAELASEQSSVLIATGQRSFLEAGGRPQEPFVFDASRSDAFDSWSHARDREQPRRRRVPLAEVPAEVHHYVDDLTDYGTWRENEEYGAVWYPTSGAGWAPYRDGHWRYTSYGYTWVSYEPWGWAPYHYGRWGYNHHGWYWIPGHHWGPAWVSFAVGPFWIGWSPLGHHGGSVFAYDHGFYGAGLYPHHHGRRYSRGGRAVPRHVYDHGAGWNFSRKEHFGRHGKARLRASDVRSTAPRARMQHQGAVLDRNLTAHAVGGDNALAPRGPRANPFARTAGVSGTRGRAVARTGVRLPAVDRGAHRGVQGTLTALAPSRTLTPQGQARPRGDASQTRARTSGGQSRVGATDPRSSFRVFRAPGTIGARGRSLEGTGTARRRSSLTRSRVTQTTPTRTNQTNRTGVRSRARTFGAGNQQTQQARQARQARTSSSRRDAVTRSPSRSRQRTTTRSGSTPSRNRVRPSNGNRATPRAQRSVTGSRAPNRNLTSITRTAPRSQRSSPSRSRRVRPSNGNRATPRAQRSVTGSRAPNRNLTSITRTAPRSQRSSPSRSRRVRSSNGNRATPRAQRSVTGSRAPSRNLTSVTRTAPRSQRSSGVSGSRGGSRQSSSRTRSGGARRRN